MNLEPLDRAISLLKTQEALAVALGIRSPSISLWRKRGKVPVERCASIEAATDGKVTRHDLRPDIFGTAPSADPQQQVA